MKKLMIALATVAMTASIAFAQTETKACDKKGCPKTEQCTKDCKDCTKCDKDCTKCDKPCDKQRACEFEGLNLTDAQKEQIKNIKAEQKAKCQAECQAKQAKKAEKKEARQAARQEYLAKIKAVLTPEQYVQYLENAATRGNKGMKRGDMRKMEGRRMDCGKGRPVCDKAPQVVKVPAKVQPAAKVKK